MTGGHACIGLEPAHFGDRPLHLLINHGGIMAAPLSPDPRGLESQVAVNHVKTEGADRVRPYAIDPAIAQRLWLWSERWP